MEESGYSAQNYVKWFETSPSEKIDWTIYTHIAKGLKKISDSNLESGEKIEIYEVSFEEFINKIIYLKNFRDNEILVKIMIAKNDPVKFEELKKLFLQ